jgi:hypothetical protein
VGLALVYRIANQVKGHPFDVALQAKVVRVTQLVEALLSRP